MRAKYPKLRASSKARISGRGSLSIGCGANILAGSRLTAPGGSQLRLGRGAHVGRDVEITPSVGHAILIGARTTLQDRCIILGDVTIGANCILSYNIYMSAGRHRFLDAPARLMRDQDAQAASSPDLQPVRIGDDCLIGVGAVIMPGVTLGRGCIVGANAVVTRSLPPYSIAAGTPARILRSRLAFAPPQEIAAFEVDSMPYFYSGFDQSAEDERAARDAGGMIARSGFELWLASTSELKLVASIKALSGSVSLTCGDEEIRLTEQWTDVVLRTDADGRAEVFANAPVVVRGAFSERR